MKERGVFALGFYPEHLTALGMQGASEITLLMGARGGDGELEPFALQLNQIDIGLIDIEDGYIGPPFAERLLNSRKPLAPAGGCADTRSDGLDASHKPIAATTAG